MEELLRPGIKLIVGLGNPGREFEKTRHNLGYEVVDFLKGKSKTVVKRRIYQRCDIEISSLSIVLLKPTTYMNRSGIAVQRIVEEREVKPSEILVIADDFNLPLGRIRLRQSGSDGGHNGLASIIAHLGTEEFPRIRMGIGPVPEGVPSEEFVLEKFARNEKTSADDMVRRTADAVGSWLCDGYEKAASIFNQALSEN